VGLCCENGLLQDRRGWWRYKNRVHPHRCAWYRDRPAYRSRLPTRAWLAPKWREEPLPRRSRRCWPKPPASIKNRKSRRRCFAWPEASRSGGGRQGQQGSWNRDRRVRFAARARTRHGRRGPGWFCTSVPARSSPPARRTDRCTTPAGLAGVSATPVAVNDLGCRAIARALLELQGWPVEVGDQKPASGMRSPLAEALCEYTGLANTRRFPGFFYSAADANVKIGRICAPRSRPRRAWLWTRAANHRGVTGRICHFGESRARQDFSAHRQPGFAINFPAESPAPC